MTRLRYLLNKLIRRLSQTSTATKRNYATLVAIGGIIGFSRFYLWPRVHRQEPHAVISNPVRNFAREHFNFLVEVTQKCAPSVVSVEVKNSQIVSPETGEPVTSSSGSGFVVNGNGWVVTNAHVVMNKPNALVVVVAPNGAAYTAKVHDIDLKLDLALLKIPCDSLPPLKLGNSEGVLPGEWVVALGNPLSLRHSISAGVISSVERTASELGITSHKMKFIQTDAAITFGHSGGPLVNVAGEVIGINNLKVTAGIAFAIPINYVKEFLEKSSMQVPPKESNIQKPPFGITTLTLNKSVVQELVQHLRISVPANMRGLLVWNVIKDSPAFKAGLIAGDVITHVNKKPISDVTSVYEMISRDANKTIILSVYRQGSSIDLYSKPIHRK